MDNYERIDTPIIGIDSKRVVRKGLSYLATVYIPPNPQQYVDNEIAKIQSGMETDGQRAAVVKMLRPVLERDAGLTE